MKEIWRNHNYDFWNTGLELLKKEESARKNQKSKLGRKRFEEITIKISETLG